MSAAHAGPLRHLYTCALTVAQAETLRDREDLGGKARGLARLQAAGFTVPRAFVITTRAFDEALHRALEHARDLDTLRVTLRDGPLPALLEQEVATHMAAIGATRWAVRSSSVEEDQAQHSFAGQQLTRLNVQGVEGVLDALREVWASLYDEAALLYRAHMDSPGTPASMAVVVQEMIAPQVAGVLFTAAPDGARPGEAIISAAPGLGEQVVGGRATDTLFVDRATGFVRQVELHDPQAPALDDAQRHTLTQAAGALHALYGAPQDVEWAFGVDDPQALVLLQLRPVTQAPPERAPEVWSNVNVGEALPGVGTPMTWSIIRRFSRKGFERAFGALGLSVPDEFELVGSFRGRVYLNLTQFMTIASGIPLLAPETLFTVAGGGGVDLVHETFTPRSAREFIKHLPVTIPRVILGQLTMPWATPLWVRTFERRCADFFGQDLTRLHPSELREELGRLDALFDRNGLIMLTASSNFLMSFIVMRELLRLWGGEDAVANEQKLLGGLRVRSAEPGLALLELGRRARRSLLLRQLITETPAAQTLDALKAQRGAEEIDEFLRELADFRARYGHRAPREAELATPRWREDTTFIFDVLKGFVTSAHLPSWHDVERERREAVEGADRAVDALFPRPFGEGFRALVGVVRGNARRRETLRALVVDSLDMYRHLLLECGRRMAETGALGEAEDVFFLHHDELQRWLDAPRSGRELRLRTLLRREVFDAFTALPDPPGTFLLRGRELVPEDAERARRDARTVPVSPGEPVARVLYGLAGCAGRVSGRARVISTPQPGVKLHDGEILVAPYADVGWTPLFLTASAVVMSLGGPLSHACIVAREYGIPTVVNARGAIEHIETGDWITVDGDRGVVLLHARRAPATTAPAQDESE